jgi:hypothetical protein
MVLNALTRFQGLRVGREASESDSEPLIRQLLCSALCSKLSRELKRPNRFSHCFQSMSLSLITMNSAIFIRSNIVDLHDALLQPILMQRESRVFFAAAGRRSRFRQSRVVDAPNNRPDEACTPCIAPPGIAHKMRYLPRIAPSLGF